jgi:hypothetical protein
MNEAYNGYKELANAIILQAVKDYRNRNYRSQRKRIKEFFRSEWYGILTDVNGEIIIQACTEERINTPV